jgi:hypothetical protein
MEENKEKQVEKEKKTWYSLHKEQVRLIQFLLYHLQKQKQTTESSIRILQNTDGKQEFFLVFD